MSLIFLFIKLKKIIPYFYILIILVLIIHFLFSPLYTPPLIFDVITLLLPPYYSIPIFQYYSILNTCFIPIIACPLLPLTPNPFNQNPLFNLVLILVTSPPPQFLIKLTPHNTLLTLLIPPLFFPFPPLLQILNSFLHLHIIKVKSNITFFCVPIFRYIFIEYFFESQISISENFWCKINLLIFCFPIKHYFSSRKMFIRTIICITFVFIKFISRFNNFYLEIIFESSFISKIIIVNLIISVSIINQSLKYLRNFSVSLIKSDFSDFLFIMSNQIFDGKIRQPKRAPRNLGHPYTRIGLILILFLLLDIFVVLCNISLNIKSLLSLFLNYRTPFLNNMIIMTFEYESFYLSSIFGSNIPKIISPLPFFKTKWA